MSAKPQPVQYGDRHVYSVAGFNHGVGGWLQRLPEVWVDGEVAEMKQQLAAASDPAQAEALRRRIGELQQAVALRLEKLAATRSL